MIGLDPQLFVSELFARVVSDPTAINDLLRKFEGYTDQQLLDLFKNTRGMVPISDFPWVG